MKKSLMYLFLVGFLPACNFPLHGPITATPNITQAYETIQAEILTMQPLQTGAALGTPFPTSVTPNPATTVPTNLSQTPRPSIPAPTAVCDRVQPGNPIDVTIPDDTVIPPGESFVKIWRLLNAGNCSWTTGYTLVWFSGEQLSTERAYSLEHSVSSGSSVDISIEMTAPSIPGTYQSNWKLQNSSGQLFGIGPAGNLPFWVRIVVPSVVTPTSTPTPTATSIPTILSSGTLQVSDGNGVILAGITLGNDQNSDIKFSNGQISSLNSTRFSSQLTSLPDYNTCVNLLKTEAGIQINNETKFKYYCFKDNSNHNGWIQILGSGGQNLDLEILTWSN
jgi:hypothetical protein